jgi:putative tricarboxylic transport membrane protein
MFKKSFTMVALTLLLCIGFTASGEAAAYPSRPLEIVAPSNPGGGWDAMARTLNRTFEVEKLYTQPISVINKPGGGGAVGMAYIHTKKGDDYELVVYSPPLIINTITKTYPHHYNTLTPLAKLITDYQVFIVKADSPYKTFGDLMAAVKKNPGAVKFAGGSNPGSMDHLAFCKVAKLAGVNPKDLTYVAFSGGGEALTTLLGGATSPSFPAVPARSCRILRRERFARWRSVPANVGPAPSKTSRRSRKRGSTLPMRCGAAYSDLRACPRRRRPSGRRP